MNREVSDHVTTHSLEKKKKKKKKIQLYYVSPVRHLLAGLETVGGDA